MQRTTRRNALEKLYAVLESYERLYQFRDPNNACLFDLRVNECYALELIVEREAVSVANLAAALGIHKSNASRIAQALRDKGLLTTEADTNDRRSLILRASAKGKKHYGALRSYLIERFEATLRDFSTSDIQTVADAIAVLGADAERRMKQPRC